jgi:hypothetical protein
VLVTGKNRKGKYAMKRTMILPLLLLCSAAVADAETYKWIDDQGVVSFTDDPNLIPSRYRSKALRDEGITIRSPKVQQELSDQKGKKRHNKLTKSRKVRKPGNLKTTPAQLGTQQPVKGHLGGDQVDPSSPSMLQPTSEPLGDQPKPTPPGMKQPIPEPLGDQPRQTPPGMKQPTPAPLGDQPKPTPLGMEQPTPVK